MKVKISGYDLTLEDFIEVARNHAQVQLTEFAIARVNNSHQTIKNIIESEASVYGVNTGFGKLCDHAISKTDLKQLQENLLKSHACGVGIHFNEEVVRGIMLLRANALAKGFSGIRLQVIEQLILYLNHNIIPVIPEQGSLGASGDLAPLAHMGLALIGLGEVYFEGKVVATKIVLEQKGLTPIKLEAKEGLSIINGTQVMTALGAITLYDTILLLKQVDIIGGLSLEALLGIKEAFDERIHAVRGQIGQIKTADNIRRLTNNSEYLTITNQIRIQDAYTLRCLAQVHGASRDAITYVREKVEIEMNAATDNPLIFDNDVLSGGNFHGEIIAQAFDFLKIAISELANISERRLERLVNAHLSNGLPAFLVAHPGLNSGFMIVQYSAASLVSENKVLSHPASVDSITSSANQEDHVSMGTIAVRQARDILANTQSVLGMELLSGCQALDFRDAKTMGEGTNLAYKFIRDRIKFIENDEIMYPYINESIKIIKSNVLVEVVEKVIGKL